MPGIGGVSQRRLLKVFGLPAAVFAAGIDAVAAVVGSAAARALLRHDAQPHIDAALAWAEGSGQSILTLADAEYPQALLRTADPPTLLYLRGRADLLNRPTLAIVGSRTPTAQGKRDAAAFAASLAQSGYSIVSGLALGVDSAAHRGALAHAASTIAVIGTGADRVYPAKNRELAHAIAAQGAIISEFPLGTPPLAANFPRRNRLIAGLGAGCLVVEAAAQSGSLITARLAADCGREVFALPGSIHSPLSKGCHRLIRQGAKLVESAQDVLEELSLPAPAPPRRPPPPDGDGNSLLAALGFEACAIDTLLVRTGLTPDALIAMLLQLELEGQVATLPGGLYQRLSS